MSTRFAHKVVLVPRRQVRFKLRLENMQAGRSAKYQGPRGKHRVQFMAQSWANSRQFQLVDLDLSRAKSSQNQHQPTPATPTNAFVLNERRTKAGWAAIICVVNAGGAQIRVTFTAYPLQSRSRRVPKGARRRDEAGRSGH